MANPMYHWELMKNADPELYAVTTAWRSTFFHGNAIPTKYVELMRVAMAATMRSVPTQRAHMQKAIKAGATKEEIFEMLSLILMFDGIPAYREVCLNLEDVLEPVFSKSSTE